MKTNLLTSLLNNCPGTQASSPAFKEVRSEVLSRLVGSRTIICPGAQPNSPASPERRGGGTGAGWYTRLQAALNNKTAIRFAKYLIPITILLLFFLLLSITSCKTPATLTNDTQHHTRDSNYHASIQRIETHDTIVIGPLRTLSNSPLKGEDSSLPLREGQGGSKSPFKGDLEGLPYSASPTARSPSATPSSSPAPTPSSAHKPSPKKNATSRHSTASAPFHLLHLFHLLH